MQSRRAQKRGDARLDQAMAASVDNSSLDVSERNSMAITFNIHTKSNTVRSRPTLVERFGNGSVRERSIYERSFTSEPSIEKYQAKPVHVNTAVYLDVIENPGGVLPYNLGRGVRPASQNPYPIYDQNLRFSLPYL